MNPSIVHVGIDVAKATLEADLPRGLRHLSNDRAGFRRLLSQLETLGPSIQICLEATGGYEQPLCDFLMAHQIPVAKANPKRVRDFAKGAGYLAKTDGIDAQVLTEYSLKMQPPVLKILPRYQRTLQALVQRRDQLVEMISMETVRLQQTPHPRLRRSIQSLVRTLKRHVEVLSSDLEALVEQTPELAQRIERLTQIQGVGLLTALALLAFVPELGTLSRNQAAALVGVAPFNQDSGIFRGQRMIRGGRSAARRHLYMAALVASRYNPILRTVYQRLRQKGKAAKLALTALMRKLIAVLNALLRDDHFHPLAQPSA